MAAAAARLLGNDSWTGQEELSFDDQAAIISAISGRPIRYQQIGYNQFKQQFLDRGASESVAQGYVDMYRAKEDGCASTASPLTASSPA
jgi:uncharacterized protein YbjT (DUF2867 family)